MKGRFFRGQLIGSCLTAIAILGGGNVPSAWAQTVINNEVDLTPLPQSQGSANDLTGTFAKDSAIWLGGVGGEGDIEATESEENPYEIRSRQPDDTIIQAPNAENPDQTRIQLGRF